MTGLTPEQVAALEATDPHGLAGLDRNARPDNTGYGWAALAWEPEAMRWTPGSPEARL